MSQTGNCKCEKKARYFFLDTLPTDLCPHSLYFIKGVDDNVQTYVTDENGVAHLLFNGDNPPGDINIESPQGTITVTQLGNTFLLDVEGGKGEDNIIESITYNGVELTPDEFKNVSFEAVETVTGNLVDNTDPYNPIVNFNTSDYDLDDFNNNSENPFIRADEAPSIHNNLSGLQGGDPDSDEFFHLDKDEHGYLTAIVSNDTISKIYDAIRVHPDYVPPTSTIDLINMTVERGSSLSINITQTFNQNDGGAKTSESIKKNGTAVSTIDTYSETLTVPSTPVVYSGNVSYAQGAIKMNNIGEMDATGRIPAGSTTSPSATITPILPYFYGKFTAMPDLDTLDLAGMTKVVVNSDSTITCNVTSNDNEFVIIAVPALSTIKTKWFITELNKGDIGGATNLFNTPTVKAKNSPSGFWGGQNFRIYYTNYKTSIQTIELRN